MTWQEMNTAPKGGAMPMSMTNDPPVGGSAPAPPPEGGSANPFPRVPVKWRIQRDRISA
jgi:hypothetical protein